MGKGGALLGAKKGKGAANTPETPLESVLHQLVGKSKGLGSIPRAHLRTLLAELQIRYINHSVALVRARDGYALAHVQGRIEEVMDLIGEVSANLEGPGIQQEVDDGRDYTRTGEPEYAAGVEDDEPGEV